MKTLLAATLTLALVAPAYGGRRRPVAVSPAAQDELTLTFIGMTGTGIGQMVDAGTMSQTRAGRTRKQFGIRINAAAAAEGETATLRAFLETEDRRVKIRIDGIVIGTVPQVIGVHVPLGATTIHVLELEIPPDVPEGMFASTIRWEASTN